MDGNVATPDRGPGLLAGPETTDMLGGPEAGDLLAAALRPAGAELRRWTLRDIDHRPHRRTTASYTAQVAWPGGIRTETFGASIPARYGDGPDGGGSYPSPPMLVSDGTHDIEVWRFPHDPALPALPAASYPATVTRMLDHIGVTVADPTVRVRAYRPLRRAVVEVTSATGTRVFVKVLRPAAVDGIRHRLELLASAGLPVPRCLGWSAEGVLVLAPVEGRPLRDALDDHGAAACDPARLVKLLDQLPAAVSRLPRRTPWADHAAHYARIIAAAFPAEAARSTRLAAEVDAAIRDAEAGDEPTHGDFYEGQLTVAGDGVSGLLDVDTAGPGRRADDLACLLGHLAILTHVSTRPNRVKEALAAWTPVFGQRVNPIELRVRTAAVLLSLATGPVRTRQARWEQAASTRLDLAERWLRTADQKGAAL